MQVTSSKKEIWTMGSYSLLTLSIMVGFMYLNTFATEVLAIPATVLATALLVAKVIDFLVSLVAGAIIEKVKISNKGKNQSWLYLGRWILAIMIMLEVCNTSASPVVVRVAVLSVSYTILNSLMNIIQTAYYGVLAAVAGPNPANRNAMTVNMTRQMTVITIICAFIPTLVTVLPFGNWNYFVVAVVFMLPMPIALGKIADLGEGKDAPVDKSAAGPSLSVGDMVDTLVKNPQMMILFLALTVLYTATYMYQANYTYYFIYVVGDFTKLTVASLVAAVVGLIAAMIMPQIGAKLGKKNSCVFGFVLFGIGLGAIAFVGAKSWIYYVICMAVTSFGTYTYTPYVIIMFLDCGEYFLWKTGKDTRAVAAGLASPPMKIGMALGGTIGLYLLGATGYVAGFTPDAAWVEKFMNVTFLIPAIVFIVSGVIMAVGYKISDADAAKYAQENAAKMMQQ
jgi:Na+/melibiose symporter-like transporter